MRRGGLSATAPLGALATGEPCPSTDKISGCLSCGVFRISRHSFFFGTFLEPSSSQSRNKVTTTN
jgi:hypothetical protein